MPGEMVSDPELVSRIREIVLESDFNTATVGTIRRKLEEILGIDLSEKRAFIREHVDLFLQTEFGDSAEDGNIQCDQDGGEARIARIESGIPGDHATEEGGTKEEEENEQVEYDEEERHTHEGGISKKTAGKNGSCEPDVKKRGGGFTKLCNLSPSLQKFVGTSQMARTQVVKNLWVYIREKNLQDPSNRRNIICDEELHSLFGVPCINMFQMNKALSKHIWPADEEDVPRQSSDVKEKKKKKKEREEDDSDQASPSEKKKKRGGFMAALPLSDALVRFLGTGENALSRGDVVKRMWEYIKSNNLQDPSDKRRILCDQKLKQLFNVDDFIGFTISKLLTSHFVKPL